MGAFLGLLTALAEFEKLEPPDEGAKRRIVDDIFDRGRLGLFLAKVGGKAAGYALYYYSYSSFLARPTLFLEDLFVKDEFRRKGVGASLFQRCVKEARDNGCGRMEWAVLTWNEKAIRFYKEAGAKRLDEWALFRLDSTEFARMAGKGWERGAR